MKLSKRLNILADKIEQKTKAEYVVKKIERNAIELVQLLVNGKVIDESEQSYEHLFNLTKAKIKESR